MHYSSMATALRCRFSSAHYPWSTNSSSLSRHSELIRGKERSFFGFHCGGGTGSCSSSTVRVFVGSGCGERPIYHPLEEIDKEAGGWKDGEGDGSAGPARISDAVMTRTLVEVHNKAALMLSGVIGDEVHGNIFWPEIPYVTDENGDIYIKVRNEQDFLKNLTAENNYVQVIIGLDNLEVLPEMELENEHDSDFGSEEEDEASDEDESDEDWVTVVDDDESEYESSDADNWTSLETMRSCHPVYFANRISEVISSLHLNWMDQPSSGLAIQGTLRPTFLDEKAIIGRHRTGKLDSDDDTYQNKGTPNYLALSEEKRVSEGEAEGDDSHQSSNTFYKLEMIDIQLVSAHGNQTLVQVEDFRRAQPDIVAQSAGEILSHFKDDELGTAKAIKSLCQRYKGIQAEEAAIIGIDSLGFDVRVCVGAQVDTLRFSFGRKATSVVDAEQKLQDLLIPGMTHEMPTKEGC